MSGLVDTVVAYLLLLPKVQVTSSAGILIAEATLVALVPVLLLKYRKVWVCDPIRALLALATYVWLISPMVNGVARQALPISTCLYYLRLLLYLAVYASAASLGTRVPEEVVSRRLIRRPYLIHGTIVVAMVVWYYATCSPSTSEILWTYAPGLRAVPLFGTSIDLGAPPFYLATTQGGSGNLLGAWTLAFLICVFSDDTSGRRRYLLIALAVLITLLSMSRGSALTIGAYLLYEFVAGRAASRGHRVVAVVFLCAMVAGAVALIVALDLPVVTQRMLPVLSSGTLDASSLGRLENYRDVFRLWSGNPFYVLFGFGADLGALQEHTGRRVIESLFLGILGASGFVGLILLAVFYFSVYRLRKVNRWFGDLWRFLAFQSIFQWSVTGGDFWGPSSWFVIMAFCGLGCSGLMRPSELERPGVRPQPPVRRGFAAPRPVGNGWAGAACRGPLRGASQRAVS